MIRDLKRWRELEERERRKRYVVVKGVEIKKRGDKGGSKENIGRNGGDSKD